MELDNAQAILDGYRPRNVSEYRTAFLTHLARTRQSEIPQAGTLKAAINYGRWVASCECGSGIALHPEWQFAACFGCGRSWSSVEFPSAEFLQSLERLFRQRPPSSVHSKDVRGFWSWSPEETLDDIHEENQRRGWHPPKGVS